MRHVPLFVKSAVVCSSATLLIGFVALKAGLLNSSKTDPGEDKPPVHMPGTKSAPLDVAFENHVIEKAENDGLPSTESVERAVSSEQLRAFSSKSSVPLIEPGKARMPVESTTDAATEKTYSKPVMMPSTKRFEVLEFTPAEVSKTAPPRTMLPGSKSAPVFEVGASTDGKSSVPRTMMSGSKSMAPLIEPPRAGPKAAPQTFSKGSKAKGT